MDDDSEFQLFGTPLKPFEEDQIPSNRPVNVQDQIVRDENGRRRFHGAFTGGFSAGFWNTVGSLEGWKPSEFKSSRGEKAQARQQKPTDFMDDEDLGEFGIAPQRVKTMEDFSDSGPSSNRGVKRKHETVGPIPGVPVLETLMAPVKDKIAVRILRKMGWKDGQGVGARLTKKEKKRAKERNAKEMYIAKKYGCDMGPFAKSQAQSESDGDESDDSDYEITFAPDDFDPFVVTVKDNSFGLGYSGLNREPVLNQSFKLFDTLEVYDKKTNKKLSIKGQAFGVGALEDDDEDIYMRDDMSKYDFTLDDHKKPKMKAIAAPPKFNDIIEGFTKPKDAKKTFQKIFKVQMPENFKPRNWMVKRSRFEPLPAETAKKLQEENSYKRQGLGRHDLKPDERGKLLQEKSEQKSDPKPSASTSKSYGDKNILDKILEKSSNFTKGGVINMEEELKPENSVTQDPNVVKENQEVQKNAAKITEKLPKSTPGVFIPFAIDPLKQERYEKFRDFKKNEEFATAEEYLKSLQPFHMSDWDREFELKEFTHAKKLYKPMEGLMFDRFVSEGTIDKDKPEVIETSTGVIKIIKMKRTKVLWKPHKDLCKRFNVPEPFGGMLIEEKPKKGTKFSVFDYIEVPTNSKTNFVTPVIVPKKVQQAKKPEKPRVSAKEFFNEEQKVVVPNLFGHKKDENQEKSKDETTSNEIPSTSTKQLPSFNKPKTELEQKVEENLNKRPEEKKDLFKSIFCDTSDEEEEEEAKPPEKPPMSDAEKMKLIDAFVGIKPAVEFNILRNKSPPRGIFKNILEESRAKEVPASKNDKNKSDSSDSSSDSDASDKEEGFYGPKLPSAKPEIAPTSSNQVPSAEASHAFLSSSIDNRLSELLKKNKEAVVFEEWVEKDSKSSKKKKKKEKHSKSSKKSKKHKKEKKKKDKK
ncbi:G patch domain-containing protein 1 homolog [Culicoides brevitarsis]|uniref:G patch domain-containing protein 1 homolog n=1 Tax=Culicoides brevitarsis TaxID=469753 RepID=UPI00307BA482